MIAEPRIREPMSIACLTHYWWTIGSMLLPSVQRDSS